MNAPYTIFGKTKMVPVVTYTNGKKDEPSKIEWDHDLWIERGEDWYALLGPPYNKSTVRVIEREVWLRSKDC